MSSRPPTPKGGRKGGAAAGPGATGQDFNSSLHHGSTIKFLKYSRGGTPAVTLDRNADLDQLGDDYEEVDYNVEDILSVSGTQQHNKCFSFVWSEKVKAAHIRTQRQKELTCPHYITMIFFFHLLKLLLPFIFRWRSTWVWTQSEMKTFCG